MLIESHCAIFAGPTLDSRDAARYLPAAYLPPVKRGDLSRLPTSVTTVGIIDGEFYQSLAVSPKEILVLIDRGLRVYGASSIGALRAVELYPYGMIGVGSVYRLFRFGLIDADDEVALSYTPDTFQSISEPLINTRYALRALVRRRVLAASEARAIIAKVKATYFQDRTRSALIAWARGIIGPERALEVQDLLAAEAGGIKRKDALRMLARIKRDLAASSRNGAPASGPPCDRTGLD
jgi:TfuA protein